MFKAERQAKIKELLREKKRVDVQSLSSLFGVSVVTIRSDLETLERTGFLHKIHGGAIISNAYQPPDSGEVVDHAYAESITKSNPTKASLGQIAAQYVHGGEWIFLGEGGTCYNLAIALAEKNNLNIVTNNLHVAIALRKNHSNNVILTGGNLYHDRLCVGGELFTACLSGLSVSKAFLGVAGVDLKSGYTLSGVGENNVFQEVRRIAKKLYIVTNNTKFDKVSFIAAGDLSIADAFISNEPIPEEYAEYFKTHNVRVITAPAGTSATLPFANHGRTP
ncbi:DeoR/GlpR family DNA-binding transcription regulator [Christensenella hongkongensis]|uniref:DeoR/GlpR family DNA-binding transcription regulator n=1 Tax=Christensenella hongkongensis TaxID=270498 RepID=UPI002672A5A2|nr:DeoR/GlpR family DNA-binding transcription regulator [Christensenella hongkongensis]